MDKAIILTSGGINSTVAAALARERYDPYLLHVAWGHRTADRELAAFEQTAVALDLKNTLVVELSAMAVFGGNARVSKRYPMEDAATLGRQTPATFAPGLMPAMLSLAASWAADRLVPLATASPSPRDGARSKDDLPLADWFAAHTERLIVTTALFAWSTVVLTSGL